METDMNRITHTVGTVISAVTAFVICGCADIGVEVADSVQRGTNVSAVIVGLSQSQYAGECPGADYDARRMRSLLSAYAGRVIYLENAAATHKAVSEAFREAVKSELCIIYYSGHGGSSRFVDTGSEEVDGKDEYLCLYDRYMRDNEIWSIVSQSKGRVFLMFDCCHSKTMFRSPAITFSCALPFSATSHESGDVNLMVWSGCPDDTYSYGSESGGEFTNALLRHFAPTKTYDCLWNEIESDTALRKFEAVQRTIIGSGFTAKPVFR